MKNIKKLLISSNNHLYYELALIINKEMFDSNNIPFNLFKSVEDEILKKIKCVKA